MRWLRSGLYVFGAVMSLVVLVVVLLFTVDLGKFKTQLEPLVSDLLDREFAIDGPLHLSFGNSIELSAENVRLAGAPWSTDPQLVTLKRLDVSVDLGSLLSGPIMIERLRVDGIRVHLEENEGGHNNWTFFEDTVDEVEEESERFRLPVMANDVRITDTVLQYDNAERSEPLQVFVAALTESIVDSDTIEIALDGEFQNTPIRLKLSTTGIDNLIALLDVQFELAGNLGKVAYQGNFAVADLLRPRHPTGMLELSGPNFEYLLDRLRVERFTTGPLRLKLNVAPRGEKMHLELDGAFGEFTMTSRSSFVDLQQLEEIDLSFSAGGPDIGRVAGIAGLQHVPNDPFTVGGALHRSGDDIEIDDVVVTIGETRFELAGVFKNFPNPDTARANIQLQIPDIGRFSQLLGLSDDFGGPLRVDGKLAPLAGQPGAVVDIKAATNGLDLAVDGHILDTPDFAGSELRLNFSGPLLSTIAGALDLVTGPDGPFAVDVVLERIAGGVNISKGFATLGDDAEYSVVFKGLVTEQDGLLGSHLETQSRGSSLAELAASAGIEAIPDLPFETDTSVAVTRDGYELKQIRVDIGQNRVTLKGMVGLDPLAGDSDLEFTLLVPDLQHALAAVGVAGDNLPGGEMEASGSVSTKEGRIRLQDIVARLADTTVKVTGEVGALPELEGTALKLEVAGADLSRLVAPGEDLKGLRKPFTLVAGIQVAQQTLRIESARFELDRTLLTADTRIQLEPLFGSGQFSLQGKSPDVLPLIPEVADLTSRDTVPLDMVAEGHWADNLWTFENVHLKLASGDLHLKGRVNGPPDFDQTDLKLSGDISSLRPLSKLAGRPLPDKPANISLHLLGRDNVLKLETFEGQIGDSDFKGDFSIRYGEVPDITLALTSKRFNLKPFLPPEPEARTDAPPEPTPPKDKNRKLIPDTRIPMDELQKFQARVNVRVDELNLRAQTLSDIVLVGSIQKGALTVDEAGFTAEHGGVLDAFLSLRPGSSGAVLGARINGNNLRVGLPANSPEAFKKLPRYNVNLALQGEGGTVRDMAGTANGYLRLVVGQGKVKATAARLLTNDFLYQLMNLVNPFATKEEPYTQVRCAHVLAALEGGQLEGKPILVAQTNRVNIFADTKIDLRTEKLNASFNTVPQKGIGFSLTTLVNPYVAVIGTLGNPLLSLDPEATIVQGGAAIATLGLSILAKGVKDRFLSSRTPCDDALKKADKDLEIMEKKYAKSIRKL